MAHQPIDRLSPCRVQSVTRHPLTLHFSACSFGAELRQDRFVDLELIGVAFSRGQLHWYRQYAPFIDRNATHVGQHSRSIWKAH